MFLHAPALAVMGGTQDPITTGILWYLLVCSVLCILYLGNGVVAVSYAFDSSSSFELAELILLSLALVAVLLLLILAVVVRTKHVGQRYQKNFMRVNLLSWVLMGITAALTGAGLGLDFQREEKFHFSQLVFLNSFFFSSDPSAFSISACTIYVAALATVPYSQTVFRLNFDKFISKSESILNVVVLGVVICSQLVVFICAIVYVATSPVVHDMNASVVLLLLVTGIFVLRGVFYLLYVGIVVSKEVRGERRGPQLLSK